MVLLLQMPLQAVPHQIHAKAQSLVQASLVRHGGSTHTMTCHQCMRMRFHCHHTGTVQDPERSGNFTMLKSV